MTGQIRLTNPNTLQTVSGVNVTDAVDNGGSCTVTGGGTNVTVPAQGFVVLNYTCTYTSMPAYTGINTATATWDAAANRTPTGSASSSANFVFDTGAAGNPTNINSPITVKDTMGSSTITLGTVTGTTSQPYASKTFNYSRSIPVAFGCRPYTNTARIVETGQTASQTVTVCGPIKTGALTMGYWQNKNGQGIITSSASTNGVCNLTTWLRQYAPYQDLSATASCNAAATYVYNIIKSANAAGSSMNPMLKAQMLATALDTYFSDPTLGGNRIKAPAPIGLAYIDLTQICGMIDSSSGTSTCGGKVQNASSAFGGATSMTVFEILAYAASQSNAGGSLWYGNVKAIQELAKNTFDAINNQVAIAP